MIAHTPTPWFVDRAGDVCAGNFCVALSPGVRDQSEEDANATLIVLAVNSHNNLVEALEYVRANLGDPVPIGKRHVARVVDAALSAAWRYSRRCEPSYPHYPLCRGGFP